MRLTILCLKSSKFNCVSIIMQKIPQWFWWEFTGKFQYFKYPKGSSQVLHLCLICSRILKIFLLWCCGAFKSFKSKRNSLQLRERVAHSCFRLVLDHFADGWSTVWCCCILVTFKTMQQEGLKFDMQIMTWLNGNIFCLLAWSNINWKVIRSWIPSCFF